MQHLKAVSSTFHLIKPIISITQARSFSQLYLNVGNVPLKTCATPLVINFRSKGSSKWHNIMHTKMAKDAAKSVIVSRLCYNLKTAIKAGGANPVTNQKFADALQACKNGQVTSATIDRVIKRAENAKSVASLHEVMGPAGSVLLVEAEAEEPSRNLSELKKLLRKGRCTGVFINDGRAKQAFESKGVILVSKRKDGQPIDKEKAYDTAIEIGAEEMEEIMEDDKPVLQFITEHDALENVKHQLTFRDEYEIDVAEHQYFPKFQVTLTNEELEALQHIYKTLEDAPEVVRIFDNAKGAST